MAAGSLRVLMLVPTPGSSGPVGHIAELLAEAFTADGVDVRTAAWGRVDKDQVRNLAARLGQALRIRRSSSLREADAVLIHTSLETRSVVTDLLLTVILGSRRPPTVLHLHGGNAHLLGDPKARVFTAVARRLLRRVQAVLVLSSEERDLLQATVPGVRCAVVANPFVARQSGPTPPPALVDGSEGRLLFVGRILREKGALTAIEATAKLRDLGRRCSLALVGDGPALESARALVSELDLADAVELAGRIAPERLEEIYAAAHVFVFPTSWPEGFPTVISEAMAAGLPIVTTANRGIVDHLVDGRNAVFVPERDADAVASAVALLLDSPDLRASMSAANRQLVQEFAPSRVAEQYLSVLRDVAV